MLSSPERRLTGYVPVRDDNDLLSVTDFMNTSSNIDISLSPIY